MMIQPVSFVLPSVYSLQVQGENLVFGQVLSRCCIDPLGPFPVSSLSLPDGVHFSFQNLLEIYFSSIHTIHTITQSLECPSHKILPLILLLSGHIKYQGLRDLHLYGMETSRVPQCKSHYHIERNGRPNHVKIIVRQALNPQT